MSQELFKQECQIWSIKSLGTQDCVPGGSTQTNQ